MTKADEKNKDALRHLFEYCTGLPKSAKIPAEAKDGTIMSKLLNRLYSDFSNRLERFSAMANMDGSIDWAKSGVYEWTMEGEKATGFVHTPSKAKVQLAAGMLPTGDSLVIHSKWSDAGAYINIMGSKVFLFKLAGALLPLEVRNMSKPNPIIKERAKDLSDRRTAQEAALTKGVVVIDAELEQAMRETDAKRRRKAAPDPSALLVQAPVA